MSFHLSQEAKPRGLLLFNEFTMHFNYVIEYTTSINSYSASDKSPFELTDIWENSVESA